MNNKHHEILKAVWHNPVLASISWKDIEALFKGLGATIEEAQGSRVVIELNSIVAVFHRPHPRKGTDKSAIKSVRRFLSNAGIEHD